MAIVSFDSILIQSWAKYHGWLAYLERGIFKRDFTRQFSNLTGE